MRKLWDSKKAKKKKSAIKKKRNSWAIPGILQGELTNSTWKSSVFREQQHSLYLERVQLKTYAKGHNKRFHVQNLLYLKVLFFAYKSTWRMKYIWVVKNLTWTLCSIAASSLVHSQGEFYSNKCWDAELQKLQKWPYQNPLEDTPLQKRNNVSVAIPTNLQACHPLANEQQKWCLLWINPITVVSCIKKQANK